MVLNKIVIFVCTYFMHLTLIMKDQTNIVKKEMDNKMETIMATKKTVKTKKAKENKAGQLGKFWIKNSLKFVKELERPSKEQYSQMLRLYTTGILVVGLFCYGIKVVHIPINNMFVAK